MIPALWISKTGLDAQQTNISVTSNNLANASTVGFKRGRAIFEDLLYQKINQPGGRSSADSYLPEGLMIGAGAKVVAFLLGVGGVSIPWDTLLLSVGLFVVIPLAAGVITRIMVIRRRGVEYFNKVFIKKFDNYTIGGLLLTLIILFSFQGETILNNPLHIFLIAVPLVLQTVLIFFVAYGWAKWWKIPHDVAAPAGMIGASNFFELAVAVAISLFGLQSGAALATVVGVLVEVPVMLTLVRIANNTRSWFSATKSGEPPCNCP